MNYVRPTISDPGWRWPFRKFSLKHKDLFTTLHDRFNTQTKPLQNPAAFHSDVCGLVLESDTLEEFYSALEKRKEQRIKELNSAWDDVTVSIGCRPALLGCRVCLEDDHEDTGRPPGSMNDTRTERWWSFVQYARMPSFDNLVTFFDGYVRDERKDRSGEWVGKRRRLAIEGNPSIATTGTTEAAEEHNKPESSSRKASSEAPTSSEAPSEPRPTSSTGQHHEARENPIQAYKMIDELCKFVNVEAIVSNDAKDLFRLMDKYKMMNGSSQDAVLYGCIFLACRKHNVTRTFGEIFYCLNANETEVRRVVKQFQDFLQRFPFPEGEGATQKPVQTTEGSAARKRTNDEDAQGSNRKRRRVMSESAEYSDVDRFAASRDKSKAADVMPTSRRAEKRKRPDDPQDEARDKRPRTGYTPVPSHFQPVPDSLIKGRFDGHAPSTNSWSPDPWAADSSADGLDMANEQWPRKNPEMPAPSLSGLASSAGGQSPPNRDLETVEASQALPRGGDEQPPAKDTRADVVDPKRSKGKSQANRRQRVDKRRSRREREMSSTQKPPPRKNRQERKASPSVDQVVRSRRSSRRDIRQKLLFLGEDGSPYVADDERKI